MCFCRFVGRWSCNWYSWPKELWKAQTSTMASNTWPVWGDFVQKPSNQSPKSSNSFNIISEHTASMRLPSEVYVASTNSIYAVLMASKKKKEHTSWSKFVPSEIEHTCLCLPLLKYLRLWSAIKICPACPYFTVSYETDPFLNDIQNSGVKKSLRKG